MPDLTYNIKISSTAEIRALHDLEESLQKQIVQARVLGQEYSALEQQLARTRTRLDEFSPGARLGSQLRGFVDKIPGLNFGTRLSGDLASSPANPGAADVHQPGASVTVESSDDALSQPTADQGLKPVIASNPGAASPLKLPSPPTDELAAIIDAFASYHAANTAALAQLKNTIAAKTDELKRYTDNRIADATNP